MGWSCRKDAMDTLDAITTILDELIPENNSSNKLPNGGFWEIGREQSDGAIVGTCWKSSGKPGFVVKNGSFRIEPNGKISRFPGLSKEIRNRAENFSNL